MKIIKKGKILPLECERCGTIFRPNHKDIKKTHYVDCPLCGRSELVQFGKEVKNEQRKTD